MLKKTTVQLMALGFVGTIASTAVAQDSGALIDALVRKGVLKDQEAEQIRSQLTRDFASQTPAGKLNISSSVKELKLSGDVRLRYQYDNRRPQDIVGQVPPPYQSTNDNQRERFRLRLRVNADYKLSDNFFGGFGLQTEQKNDSGNQTMAGGNGRTTTTPTPAVYNNGTSNAGDYFQNYSIFINKAFIGWNVTPGLTLVGGKQANPFYTTDMVWDPDINPAGFSQRVDLHKFLNLGPIELSLVAGEMIVSDNNEFNPGGKTSRDGWIYQTQLQVAAKLSDDLKLTVAPGYYFTNNANATSGGGGEANIDTPFRAGSSILEGLQVYLLPGDLSFKVAGMPAKFVWDFAYNNAATYRSINVYNSNILPTQADRMAYLAGFVLGENKKKGDFSVLANYRVVGLSAVDPNINDSDWALSFTNMQGWKAGFMYNIGDATTFGITFYQADNLRKQLGVRGQNIPATGTSTGGLYNGVGSGASSVMVLQADLSIKF